VVEVEVGRLNCFVRPVKNNFHGFLRVTGGDYYQHFEEVGTKLCGSGQIVLG
jgi:hypothetical protein